MEDKPDVILTYNPVIDQDDLKELREAFLRLTPNLIAQEQSQSVQNNIDWFLPAVVIIFIAKEFSSGFLQEISADIYQGLKKVLRSGKAKPVQWHTLSSSSEGKYVKTTLSPLLSITFKIESSDRRDHSVQFIFPADVDIRDAEKAIDVFRDTVLNIVKKEQAELKNESGESKHTKRSSYAFVPELSEWKELTPDFLYEYHSSKKKKKAKRKKKKD